MFEQIVSLLNRIVWSPALVIRALREYEHSLKGNPRPAAVKTGRRRNQRSS